MARQKRLQDFVLIGKRLSEDEFLREHNYPVLLHREAEDAFGGSEYITGVVHADTMGTEPSVAMTDPWLVVLAVQKRPGGAFRDQIGVGRTRNNDIALPYARISKYHAYFTRSEDGKDFFLADAGSKNGTFVDGDRLPVREAVRLEDGVSIAFAEYQFRFCRPSTLYRVVTRVGPEGVSSS